MDTFTRRAVVSGVGSALVMLSVPALAQGLPPRPPGFPPINDNLLAQFRTRLIQSAFAMRGQRVGDGQCTSFVSMALRNAGFPFSEASLYWGQPWNGVFAPGLVMQMYDRARWEGPNGYFHTDNQHTLILVGATGGGAWTVIHQNWGQERVTVDELDFSWRMIRGRTALFHPFA